MIDTVRVWHDIIRTRDLSRLDDLFADDVMFYSPVVYTPQSGKSLTLPYLQAAFHVFLNETFSYVREVTGDRDAVLEFQVEIDGLTINGVDMIKWDDAGRIVEFKVMLRPLKAVNLIHQKMGEMLAKRSNNDQANFAAIRNNFDRFDDR